VCVKRTAQETLLFYFGATSDGISCDDESAVIPDGSIKNLANKGTNSLCLYLSNFFTTGQTAPVTTPSLATAALPPACPTSTSALGTAPALASLPPPLMWRPR
jgi:hypothetical protein